MEHLENGFCEIDGVDPSTLRNKGSPPKDNATITTNIIAKGGPIGSKPNSS
jgi:hypothetical protein